MSRLIALALLLAAAGIYACGGSTPGLESPYLADSTQCTVPTVPDDGGPLADDAGTTLATGNETPSAGPECATGQ